MIEKTCCFTGHRIFKNATPLEIRKKVYNIIYNLVMERGITRFVCGGAIGFDTEAALAVLKLKERISAVNLCLILPCANQDEKWGASQKKLYNDIMRQADEVEIIQQQYTKGCMQERNRRMVDSSSVCVAYIYKQTGGTAYTVKYAKSKELDIIYI